MTTKEVLIKAKSLIEQGWVQYVAARTKNGKYTYATDVEACKWCATGALMAAENKVSPNQDCLRLLNDICSTGVIHFNDDPNTTQADIISLFDKAIKRCDNEPS